jgi:predicted phage tail protein
MIFSGAFKNCIASGKSVTVAHGEYIMGSVA